MKKVILSIFILLIAGSLFASNSGPLIDLSHYSNEELSILSAFITHYVVFSPISFLGETYDIDEYGELVEGVKVSGNVRQFLIGEANRVILEFDNFNIFNLFSSYYTYFSEEDFANFLLYGFPTILEGEIDAYYFDGDMILFFVDIKLLLKTFTSSAIYHVETEIAIWEDDDLFIDPLILNGREVEVAIYELDHLHDLLFNYWYY